MFTLIYSDWDWEKSCDSSVVYDYFLLSADEIRLVGKKNNRLHATFCKNVPLIERFWQKVGINMAYGGRGVTKNVLQYPTLSPSCTTMGNVGEEVFLRYVWKVLLQIGPSIFHYLVIKRSRRKLEFIAAALLH